jgi:hypothetical protein
VTNSRDIGIHIASCIDGLYRGLGEAAPALTTDAYVVRAHEASRAFGAVSLGIREHLGGLEQSPFVIIEAMLRNTAEVDPTGALSMYATSMLLVPRILVSLLDARSICDDAELVALFDEGSQTLVREIHAIGDAAKLQPTITDESWQLAARDLSEMLENAGFDESFGTSH